MSARTQLDLFKRYRNEYVAPRQPRLIHIEPAQYLVIATADTPNDSGTDAPEKALYLVASALRTVTTAKHQRDFIFGKLEWLLSDTSRAHAPPRKVMMRVPNFVTSDDLSQTMALMLARGFDETTVFWIRRAQLEQISENLCMQMLMTGPSDAESQARTLAALQNSANIQGLEVAGPAHAVDLASSRAVSPEHVRTLLRYPVRAVSVADCALV